jgi:hypothetical protein
MGHHHDLHRCVDGLGPVASVPAKHRPVEQDYDDSAGGMGALLLDRGSFQIRLANLASQRKSDLLVDRMYAWRGYKASVHDPQVGARRELTLQACFDEEVFGTLNVGFDSPAGLASDALYKAEIDAYRESGVVAEFTRLAIDPERGSKELLGALFHSAYRFASQVGGATHMFIEINPRHVAFYKRMLNFRPAGACNICPRVGAPAVLLQLPVAYMREQAARCGGHRCDDQRSLYPYYCSPQEEEILAMRIEKLPGNRPAAADSAARMAKSAAARYQRAGAPLSG